MLVGFKTEIDPNPIQKDKINRTIGTCRFIYNFYLAYNKKLYDEGKPFMSGKAFSVWLNNEYLPEHQEKAWIKDVSSKSVKHSIEDANVALLNFFKHKSKFPKFKKKSKSDVKMYFVKNNPKDCECERHRIKIPTLGWVKIKEKGYIPTTKQGYIIRSGAVSIKAERYYVSVLTDMPEKTKPDLKSSGLGIDLGIKDLAICSDKKIYKNINKTSRVRKLEKKLKREQRSLSRKYESLKKSKNITKGKATRQNIRKQKLNVQKLHYKLNCIRTDYINKFISETVKTKPSYITIEDLNVSGMMKNRHLSKAVAQQKFYEIRTKLQIKCKAFGIELRLVDRFYPSSKTCHNCGCIKHDLKLSDRVYHCNKCGYTEDRDYNASLNLRDCQIYTIA